MSAGFISEMNALPVHGGGITLERVLGTGLKRFDFFTETVRYPHQVPAEYPDARNHSYPLWPIQQMCHPLLGSQIPFWLASHPLTRRSFARSVARRLLQDEPSLADSHLLVCPQGQMTLLVLEELQKSVPLKYVTWIMDDHAIKWKNGEWVYPIGFETVMQRHLENAAQVYVISPALQRFYKYRFRIDSTVLCGPAPLTQPCSMGDTAGDDLNRTPRLAYFGSLGRWQNDAIDLLSPLIAAGDLTLDVYSRNPESLPKNLANAGAQVRESIPAAEVLTQASLYNAVVLPISFKPELRNMSFFNVATKFSECLASAVPTLLIGPKDAAMVAIASEADACLIADQASEESMKASIKRLHHPESRAAIVASEHRLLKAKFTPEIMRKRWAAGQRFLDFE